MVPFGKQQEILRDLSTSSPEERAQCEANSDLARLLIDEIGDGSINPQAREQQAAAAKSVFRSS